MSVNVYVSEESREPDIHTHTHTLSLTHVPVRFDEKRGMNGYLPAFILVPLRSL